MVLKSCVWLEDLVRSFGRCCCPPKLTLELLVALCIFERDVYLLHCIRQFDCVLVF